MVTTQRGALAYRIRYKTFAYDGIDRMRDAPISRILSRIHDLRQLAYA